jgi:hypothetical protein
MPLIVTAQIVDADSSPRAHRKPVDRVSTLRDQQSRPHDVHVENLSATGCFLWSDVPLALDSRILLGLAGGGVVEGTIIRRDGDNYGCQFLIPLTNAQLHTAFGRDALIEGVFGTQAPPVNSTERWPRPARGTALIGLAATAWALIAFAIQSFRG